MRGSNRPTLKKKTLAFGLVTYCDLLPAFADLASAHSERAHFTRCYLVSRGLDFTVLGSFSFCFPRLLFFVVVRSTFSGGGDARCFWLFTAHC